MHILEPKHYKLDEKESDDLLGKMNISRSQLPKILLDDPALPEGCKVGDIIRVEREVDGKTEIYYRVIV